MYSTQLKQFTGDVVTHQIPLKRDGSPFDPTGYTLVFTLKVSPSDTDAVAVCQKRTNLGINAVLRGTTWYADVSLVPQDTETVASGLLVFDIQAWRNTPTVDVITVAFGTLSTTRDITRLRDASIPIYTTVPPYDPGTGSSGPVQWGDIENKPATFPPTAHSHGDSDITALSATKITGVINLNNLPASVVERLVLVADQAARLALTLTTVQNGDTVKQLSDGALFFVKNDTVLGTEAAFEPYSVGSAATVPWSGVTGKPTTVSGYGLTDVYTKSEVDAHTHTFASLTSKPTTVAGYGITDAYTKSEVDSVASVPVAALTYATTVTVPLAAQRRAYTLSATGNFTLALSGQVASYLREVVLEVLCDGTNRTPTFPAGWVWLVAPPTALTANKRYIFSITSIGAASTDVRASWKECL